MKYTAFISYNSQDDRWARWLQRKLEGYLLPTVIRNERKEVVQPRKEEEKKMRVFRYKSDLNTISLDQGLAKELDDARFLIVICSPNSAKSEWVGREIQHFINTGRRDHIIPFIVEGTSYSNGDDECLNPVLKAAFPDGDILGVNINDYGDDPRIYRKRKALVRTVSILIEVPDAYHYLWNRYRLRYWEGVAVKAAGVVAIAALVLYAWHYNTAFDTNINIVDKTPPNAALPVPDTLYVAMKLDNEEKTLELLPSETKGTFKNLPGRYAGKTVSVSFKAHGFETVDTTVVLERGGNIALNILRDDTYGMLAGTVFGESGQPLEGAQIEAEGITTSSLEDGTFRLYIPIQKQKPCPHVQISKTGYHTEEFTEQAIGTEWQVMLMR